MDLLILICSKGYALPPCTLTVYLRTKLLLSYEAANDLPTHELAFVRSTWLQVCCQCIDITACPCRRSLASSQSPGSSQILSGPLHTAQMPHFTGSTPRWLSRSTTRRRWQGSSPLLPSTRSPSPSELREPRCQDKPSQTQSCSNSATPAKTSAASTSL